MRGDRPCAIRAPRTVPDVAVLDPAALENLLSMLGGEFVYLEELIDSFLEDAPQLLAELDQFVEGGDSAGVRRVAHSLKSNGADFGATTFSNLCKELEMVGKSGDAGWSGRPGGPDCGRIWQSGSGADGCAARGQDSG